MAGKTTEEPVEEKKTLPVGHPQAGYITPELSVDTTGMPPAEAQWHEDRMTAWQAEHDAVVAHEHNVATIEEAVEAPDSEPKKATSTKTSST